MYALFLLKAFGQGEIPVVYERGETALSLSKGLSEGLSTLMHRFILVLANRYARLFLNSDTSIRFSLPWCDKRFGKTL
jgi:hypothetical protein